MQRIPKLVERRRGAVLRVALRRLRRLRLVGHDAVRQAVRRVGRHAWQGW